MRLTALTERAWLPAIVKRDLFLFGLEDVPLGGRAPLAAHAVS
jgi:hypothetical protein